MPRDATAGIENAVAAARRAEPEDPRPRFIGSEIYRRSSYGDRHPLAIPRVSTLIDLSRALGWLPDTVYIDSPRASPAELARFHDPAYIEALQAAEHDRQVAPEVRHRFNLGRNGNPVFAEMFRRPATACGGSILAGRRLAAAPGVIYSPAGGTHHGRRDRASGFCYLNDPALAVLALLDGGVERVLYLDLDAHHGDGVQLAFHDEPRVRTISIHEDGRWPMARG
ncbi:MAG TPA: acetoin utilization protein AcuC, partial [Kiloniellales bacterium]|nr:acetoin utilization protein AcuC [Kiloniellales bacterium]